MRKPQQIYFNHGLIKFSSKNKIIYYTVWLWNPDGTTQFKFETGKYDGNPEAIIKRTQPPNLDLENVVQKLKSPLQSSLKVLQK